ncbi:MAG: TRAP transporter small permease subunit [Desulfamplus sp.]|nr:TRAP transporter small permease subunit [Desulfamplus sp.]
MLKLSEILDKIIIKQGQLISYLIPILVIITGFEVFARYVLSSPTVWGLEFTTFLFGIHFVMGFSYTEYFGGHVNVDIVSSRMSPKAQAILWIAATVLFTLPVTALLIYGAIVYGYESVSIWERNSTAWTPYIWPVKLFIPAGFILLFMQLLSNVIKKINSLKTL